MLPAARRILAFAAVAVTLATTTAGAQSSTPELVAPGVVSTQLDELNFALSRDGEEVYFTLNSPEGALATIVVSKRRGEGWGAPETAPFSGRYADYDPIIAPDGRLYFISNRPRPDGTRPPGDFDIYYVQRNGKGWSEPVRLPAPINSDRPEFYPALASDGTLYFSANRDGGHGRFDLWRSRLVDGVYQTPENLGPNVNGPGSEVDSWIAPDQSFIIFASYDRPDELGRGDLYISYFRNNEWTPARNLGAPINSSAREYCPIASPDGRWFYFTSKRGMFDTPPERARSVRDIRTAFNDVLNGYGNVYRVPMEAVHKEQGASRQ